MTQEKWSEIQDMVREKFTVLEEKTEPLEFVTDIDGKQKIGDKEILIFDGPMGKTKLEYIIKPVVLDKKEHYTNRVGSKTRSEYVLSDTEFTRRLEAYILENNIWQKIDASAFEN